jgi:hypothetical protein
VQEGDIHTAKRLQIRRLLSGTLPLFVMTLMTLLAVFRTNEDFLDFRHPLRRRLHSRFFSNRPVAMLTAQTDEEANECYAAA